MEENYERIPQEKFEFVQTDERIHDKKFDTKARGYLADAFIRFKKNKSSVVAAIIILCLIIFAIVAPIISPYNINDKDKIFINYPPFIEEVANANIGIYDGGVTYDSQNETQLLLFRAIAEESGRNPLLSILETYEKETVKRGQVVKVMSYKVRVNRYYTLGIKYMTLSYEAFEEIQKYQNETGIQVIYPYVEAKDIEGISDNPNIWYKVSDNKGTPKLDKDGNFIRAYSTSASKAGAEYNSIRIEGDDGSYIYSIAKSGAVQCRIDYYNYYKYVTGHAPMFIFGTNSIGQDLFCAIGIGARFSLVFAILVSAINLTIGAVYGAVQGYYGGAVDLILDRIADILYEVPFIVVSTLFQLHLAPKVGVVPSFLFAFVLTGWIGMAALTRKQFYRFKGQEYILAAKTLGARDSRIMFKHIFPNALGTIITSCVLVIPGVIGSETTLTYLGIVNLSEFAGTSIGTLMSQGQAAMTTSPHAMFYPALFVSLLLITFNLFGNGLRDAFNPSTRGVED
ncbi:MAG: ABC transporter permease [Clostridiales bacterium]|nr:ABC transporter permease [Clostridiales bacterium]